jgi:hypothetical protein
LIEDLKETLINLQDPNSLYLKEHNLTAENKIEMRNSKSSVLNYDSLKPVTTIFKEFIKIVLNVLSMIIPKFKKIKGEQSVIFKELLISINRLDVKSLKIDDLELQDGVYNLYRLAVDIDSPEDMDKLDEKDIIKTSNTVIMSNAAFRKVAT